MAQKIFEYAIIYNPKPTKDSAGNDTTAKSELLVDVTRILADDEKSVAIVAARAIPESHIDKLSEVQIAIRPF